MKTLMNMAELDAAVREVAPNVCHSMYEHVSAGGSLTTMMVKAEKLDEVYRTGRVRFVRYEGWESEVYDNPTWGDVMKAMQASIEALDDFHHVFLEGLSVQGTEFPHVCGSCGRMPVAGEKSVSLVEFTTGS